MIDKEKNKLLYEILIKEIKNKNQISELEDSFVFEKIEKFFLTNGNIRKKIEKEFEIKNDKILKSKITKEFIKKIREEIGQIYGLFQTKEYNKKEKFLEKYFNNENNNEYLEKVLKTHKSTKERFEYYDFIYSKIFEWHKPKKICDLACGLNPLSFDFIENSLKYKPEYFASDLNPKDMEFINEFFKKKNIKGIAKNYDICKLDFIYEKELEMCDLLFLFKCLDSFETIKKDISKEILKKIDIKNIIVSFPKISPISKKIIKIEKRNWFFNFIEKENWNYDTFEIENELFIMIKK